MNIEQTLAEKHYRYTVVNNANGLKLYANDYTEIASIMWLWGDKITEWGMINCPSVINGEADFICALSKENVTINVSNN